MRYVPALFKQAQFANKITLIQIGEDHFFTLFVFDQHCHRAFNDVVQRFRFFTLVNKRALGWVLMNVAMRQEPFESRVCLRFAKHHARLSSVISFLQSQKTPLSLDCRNVLPAIWEEAVKYVLHLLCEVRYTHAVHQCITVAS